MEILSVVGLLFGKEYRLLTPNEDQPTDNKGKTYCAQVVLILASLVQILRMSDVSRPSPNAIYNF